MIKIHNWYVYGYKTAFNPVDTFPSDMAKSEYLKGCHARYEDVKHGATDKLLLEENPYQD